MCLAVPICYFRTILIMITFPERSPSPFLTAASRYYTYCVLVWKCITGIELTLLLKTNNLCFKSKCSWGLIESQRNLMLYINWRHRTKVIHNYTCIINNVNIPSQKWNISIAKGQLPLLLLLPLPLLLLLLLPPHLRLYITISLLQILLLDYLSITITITITITSTVRLYITNTNTITWLSITIISCLVTSTSS